MKGFRDPEELVAAYWQKLARSVENGTSSHSKAEATNGRLRPRSSRDRRRVLPRAGVLRNGKHLAEIRREIDQHAELHSHSRHHI